MPSDKPEVAFDLEELLNEMTTAFTKAAAELRQTFQRTEWAGTPYVYHMPKMSLSLNLALSLSNGKLKGFFTGSEEQRLHSKIEIDVVAVPRLPSSASSSAPGGPPSGTSK